MAKYEAVMAWAVHRTDREPNWYGCFTNSKRADKELLSYKTFGSGTWVKSRVLITPVPTKLIKRKK